MPSISERTFSGDAPEGMERIPTPIAPVQMHQPPIEQPSKIGMIRCPLPPIFASGVVDSIKQWEITNRGVPTRRILSVNVAQ